MMAGADPAMPDLRFLALGDSYTIGESVPPREGWPVQLAGFVRDAGIPLVDPRIVAATGWTTAELDAAIHAAMPEGLFDLVSLLIGVNNQYRGYPVEEYRLEFRRLLSDAIVFAGGHTNRVFTLSIPDWGVTPFAEGRDRARIALEIDLFNGVNREESLARRVRYLDITPLSRLAATDPRLVASDGLHPSGKMYQAWASLALPVVMEMILSQHS